MGRLYQLMMAKRDESQVATLSRFFKTGKGQYGEAMAREYQADMKEEYKKRDCLENGRKYKGDIKGLIDSLKADYTDKKEKRIEAGKNGDRKKKSEGGKKSKTNNNKKCCVMVVYRDRSEIIEADSRKEMTHRSKFILL